MRQLLSASDTATTDSLVYEGGLPKSEVQEFAPGINVQLGNRYFVGEMLAHTDTKLGGTVNSVTKPIKSTGAVNENSFDFHDRLTDVRCRPSAGGA